MGGRAQTAMPPRAKIPVFDAHGCHWSGRKFCCRRPLGHRPRARSDQWCVRANLAVHPAQERAEKTSGQCRREILSFRVVTDFEFRLHTVGLRHCRGPWCVRSPTPRGSSRTIIPCCRQRRTSSHAGQSCAKLRRCRFLPAEWHSRECADPCSVQGERPRSR